MAQVVHIPLLALLVPQAVQVAAVEVELAEQQVQVVPATLLQQHHRKVLQVATVQHLVIGPRAVVVAVQVLPAVLPAPAVVVFHPTMPVTVAQGLHRLFLVPVPCMAVVVVGLETLVVLVDQAVVVPVEDIQVAVVQLVLELPILAAEEVQVGTQPEQPVDQVL